MSADHLHESTEPSRSALPGLAEATDDILKHFAAAIGLPMERCSDLRDARPFVGPAGLACRVHVTGDPAGVRPEVLLPMSVDELSARELRSLLKLQSFVLSEFGWYLGPSPDGRLTLSAYQWIEDPQQAAAALDLANGLARGALTHLIGEGHGDSHADQHQ
jgi:hypothetical protein